jgi:ribosomal protein L12E/L44/L45/RPP1/RPP2
LRFRLITNFKKDLRVLITGYTMKRIKTLLLTAALMMITAGITNAQEVQVTPDTARVRAQQGGRQAQEQQGEQTREQARSGEQTQAQAGEQSREQVMNQTQAGEQTQSQAGAQTQTRAGEQAGSNSQTKVQNQGANASGVKKVQSARPDWSKARGARPASIERPSGSRIPKGAGKPAGAKGPGRR